MSDLLSYSIMYNSQPRKVVLPPLMGNNNMPISLTKSFSGITTDFPHATSHPMFGRDNSSLIRNSSELAPSQMPVALPLINNLNLTENNLRRYSTSSQNSWSLPLPKSLWEMTPRGPSESSTGDSLPESYEMLLVSSPLQLSRLNNGYSHVREFQSSVQLPVSGKDQRKRRQRLGPSCDACRSRKVKCTAEVTPLNGGLLRAGLPMLEEATEEQLNELANNGVPIILRSGSQLIRSNDKFIKFNGCQSCKCKGLNCLFSKGFTKEDMMGLKRSSVTSIKSHSPQIKYGGKVTKKREPGSSISASRKSSCIACRKRKVRCSFNQQMNKCEGCHKRNYDCLFDHT